MSEEDKAVDRVADAIKIVIRGWPIYSVVVALMWSYGNFFLDDKIALAIAEQTLVQPAVVTLVGAVQTNTNSINRVESKVEEVEGDTKAILLHLAGE
jgi:hypothetical protein